MAYEAIEKVSHCEGDPVALCNEVVNMLDATCVGVTKAFRETVQKRLTAEQIELKRPSKLNPFFEKLVPLYENPTVATWCRVIESVIKDMPAGVTLDFPDCLRLVGSLRTEEGEDPLLMLEMKARVRRLKLPQHNATVSTIHKVKGQEYDHVFICHCSAGPFPDSEYSRKLLHVALSRARKSITILGSRRAPSPLLA